MRTTKITNGLLAIIAICLLWIAFKPDDGNRIMTASIVPSATAQTEEGLPQDQKTPIEVICTISSVEEAAARTLVGSLQTEVIAALNQTNTALWGMRGPLAEIVQSLQRVEGKLQKIDQNTSSY
jgi:hypothetical protein